MSSEYRHVGMFQIVPPQSESWNRRAKKKPFLYFCSTADDILARKRARERIQGSGAAA